MRELAPKTRSSARLRAEMGAVVFTYDMVAWGDSRQVDHRVDDVIRLQLWDRLRASDASINNGTKFQANHDAFLSIK